MPFSSMSPTISSGGINSILNALQQMGIDLVALKKEVGLDEFNLEDSELRLSCQYASACYKAAQGIWEGENFGLVHGLKYQPFTLGIVGHLLTTASNGLEALKSYERYQQAFGDGLRFDIFTLGIVGHLLTTASNGLEALKSYERYQQAFGDGLRFDIEEQQNSSGPNCWLTARLWIHSGMSGKVDCALVDSFFVALMNCIRLLTGETEPLLRVELKRPAPENIEEYVKAFACTVLFSQEKDQVILSSHWLEKPLLTANPYLYQMLEQQSASIIKKIGECNLFSNQVRLEILKCIDGNKVDITRVARRLSISSRTLQRRLKAKGDRFQSLLDEVRTEFSVQQIKLNRISIDEQAYLLGFSDPSIYRKSFKRWTGQTPTEYRLSLTL